MLIDVHAHLDWKNFEKDLDKVIDRAEKNNVKIIIANGINPKSNRKVLEISKKYKIVKPALGIYPIDSLNLSEEEINKEINFIKNKKPFAIGEIGLDLYHTKELSKQKKVFEQFLELAEKIDVPVIVHARQAEKETIEILETTKLKKVILHTFMGKLNLIKRAEENGYYFSIPPIVNHSEQFKKLIEEVSSSRLLTETDSPFLSHKRGERNEPCNVKVVVENIAKIKGLDLIETQNIIFMNFQKLFQRFK